MPLSNITKPVKHAQKQVEQIIFNQLDSQVPLINKIGKYLLKNGGKRLRPLVTLLSAQACAYDGDTDKKLAAIVELLHTATLLHDDVVDGSKLRRGQSTANEKWGNDASVLAGDFLYTRAFEMMVDINDFAIMKVISQATREIVEGEMLQLTNIANTQVSEDTYLKIIHAKTATLFETAAKLGALVSKSSTQQEEQLASYGYNLGIAFQLVDDLLDYMGDTESLGKNIGDDLADGKLTLPLIHALAEGHPEKTTPIRQAIENGTPTEHLATITELMSETGALEYTKQQAQKYTQKAVTSTQSLPDSTAKKALVQLAEYAISRTT